MVCGYTVDNLSPIRDLNAKGCGASEVRSTVGVLIIVTVISGYNMWAIVLLWLNYDPNLVLRLVPWPTTRTFKQEEGRTAE